MDIKNVIIADDQSLFVNGLKQLLEGKEKEILTAHIKGNEHAKKRISSEVRDISSKLTPNSFFILGCSDYIKEYLQEINNNSKLTINTKFYCDIKDQLDNEIGFQIFRIIQEATQNCVKYAGIANVIVQIIMHETYTSLTIDDDGNGFDQNNTQLLKGSGLENMRMRTKILNGNFEITSTIGKGTNIIVSIPR